MIGALNSWSKDAGVSRDVRGDDGKYCSGATIGNHRVIRIGDNPADGSCGLHRSGDTSHRAR